MNQKNTHIKCSFTDYGWSIKKIYVYADKKHTYVDINKKNIYRKIYGHCWYY